jgi:alpha-galactosidase
VFEWTDESYAKQRLFVEEATTNYDIKAAGINHFTWMVDIRRQKTGENLYPLVREDISELPANFEPLTQHMFKIFGLLPVPGDCHITEYLPYTTTKENWTKYEIKLYDFEWGQKSRECMWNTIQNMVNGTESLDKLYLNPFDRGEHVITGIFSNSNSYEPALNITNNGAISNLPDDAVVEVPVILNRMGAFGIRMGKLPEAIAALCNREISIAKLITKASITGDKEAAIQAFALDPMINDLTLAETILDDYLHVHKKYLPQFH